MCDKVLLCRPWQPLKRKPTKRLKTSVTRYNRTGERFGESSRKGVQIPGSCRSFKPRGMQSESVVNLDDLNRRRGDCGQPSDGRFKVAFNLQSVSYFSEIHSRHEKRTIS